MDRRLYEIHQTLVEHERMLAEALQKIRCLENESGLGKGFSSSLRNRKLRLIQLISKSRMRATVTWLARTLSLDRKTVRKDLSFLAKIGLVAYQTAPSHYSNPGRKGNRPQLTKRGRLALMHLDDLDKVPEEGWSQTSYA